jgi:hypothetical protein
MVSKSLSPHTVYVLGAGFSREAMIPLQAEILQSIRKLSISDAPVELVDVFLDATTYANQFLIDVFGSSCIPSLENIFTLLDETITQRRYCHQYSWRDLDLISNSLTQAILYLFYIKERNIPDEGCQFYDSLAASLIKQRLKAGQAQHPFSIVSLNWDCVLDNAFYNCISQGLSPYVDVDYCCYTNLLEDSTGRPPSITQKSRGIFNVKVMKLHGSTNWLICPKCHRLYVGLGAPANIWTLYLKGAPCPRCDFILSQSKDSSTVSPLLEPFFVTPTFLKRFENPHIRMVWHNAYLDLCEASRIVFIGYSFPEADYQVRTLLKRAIRPEAEINVVLCDRDRPRKKKSGQKSTQTTVDRYKEFFESCAKVSFDYSGVKGYFEKVFGKMPLSRRISSLKRTFTIVCKTAKKSKGSYGRRVAPI